MSIDNKVGIGRSLGLKIGTIAITSMFAFLSYLGIGCKAEEVKPYEQIKETTPIVETVEEKPYETDISEAVSEETEQEPKSIDDIIFYTTDKDMFGPDADPSNFAVSADPEKMERINKIVYSTVSMYPEDFLVENLDRIYILSELGSADTKINGSYHPQLKRIYVVIDPEPGRGIDELIEGTLHHEISHVLLENDANDHNYEIYSEYFDEEAWREINPEGFEYTGKNARSDYVPSLFEKGFLTLHGEKNVEEDLATFAEGLFTEYKPFWTAVKEHERLKQKLDLTKDFYIALDKGFEPLLKQQYETHGLEWISD